MPEQNRCKKCNKILRGPQETHTCDTETSKRNDDGDFGTSMMIGMATDSALLGYVVGGDLGGAMLGDMLSGND